MQKKTIEFAEAISVKKTPLKGRTSKQLIFFSLPRFIKRLIKAE